MRNAFIDTLIKKAEKDKRIFLLTGDLGFTVVEPFIKRFPDRFLNMGVAEANMVGVAAGLAHCGKIPVVYSIATFLSMRAFEQIRNDVALAKSNVKIVGVGAGLTYGHAGPTHHSIEDVALMRTLPEMKVIVPSDPVSTAWATEIMIKKTGTFYLRLGKKGEPNIHPKKTKFTLGKGKILREGKNITLIASGTILHNALKAAKILTKGTLGTVVRNPLKKRQKISVRVIDIHTVKPIDRRLILSSAKKTKYIFSIEEHNVIGGLGSAVAECLAEEANFPFVFKRIGIPDVFCQKVGNHQYLRDHFCLSPEKIAAEVKKVNGTDLGSE